MRDEGSGGWEGSLTVGFLLDVEQLMGGWIIVSTGDWDPPGLSREGGWADWEWLYLGCAWLFWAEWEIGFYHPLGTKALHVG